MPVDFSTLVLGPAMRVFGRPVTIDPISSRPGRAPYEARGIYTSRPMEFLGIEREILSDQHTTLGIRLADFTTGPPPAARDVVTIDRVRYVVDDLSLDGEGGATLTLRHVTPDYPQR